MIAVSPQQYLSYSYELAPVRLNSVPDYRNAAAASRKRCTSVTRAVVLKERTTNSAAPRDKYVLL